MSMKEASQRELQAQMDEWNADIDKLKAKADKAGADAQLEYYKQIEKLRSMQQAPAINWPSSRRPATTHGRTSRQVLKALGTHSATR